MNWLALTLSVATASELDLWRGRAALGAGELDQALILAGAALQDAPDDWQAHALWQDVLLAQDARWWLDAEYAALVDHELAGPMAQVWVGEIPDDTEAQARRLLDVGRPKQALALLTADDPEHAAWRLEALSGADLRKEARALWKLDPTHPERLAPLLRADERLARPLQRQVTQESLRMLESNDPVLVYRAHAALVASGDRELALVAVARLAELDEPFPVGAHAPWDARLTRDVGKVLAMRSHPVLPEGSPPKEQARAYAAAARELDHKGRSEAAAELWRELLDRPDLSGHLRLEATLYLEHRGLPPAMVLEHARAARASFALHDGTDTDLARCWFLEARALRALGHVDDALLAVDTAIALGAEPTALVLQGELLEMAGHPVPAFKSYAQAASRGVEGLEQRLGTLYPGLGAPEQVVDAWPTPEIEAPDAAPERVRFPDVTLQTSAGDVQTHGQWTVLFFWASWCHPCLLELPEADDMTARLEGHPVALVAVSVDDTPEDAVKSLNTMELTELPTAWNPDLATQTGIHALPTVVVLTPDGYVHHRRQGYQPGDIERLEQEILQALQQAD